MGFVNIAIFGDLEFSDGEADKQFLIALQDKLIDKKYEYIMETLKGTQWILQCEGCFALTDGDIVLSPTNTNFNQKRPCKLFFLPNIVSITTITIYFSRV